MVEIHVAFAHQAGDTASAEPDDGAGKRVAIVVWPEIEIHSSIEKDFEDSLVLDEIKKNSLAVVGSIRINPVI
jgi:hypothetical protein